ncbi:MAG: ROK family transcriptional regulator [Ruthenibacterium sp.]
MFDLNLINQQLIKNKNLKAIYNCIFENRGISRAEVAKRMSLSKTAVSSLVDELIEKRFVVDGGVRDSDNVGRKPNSLQLRSNCHYVFVLNWMVLSVECSIVDVTGGCVFQYNATLSPDKQENFLTLSKRIVYEQLLKQVDADTVLGVCVIVSAMIDLEKKEIYSTTVSLSGKGSQDLVSALPGSFPEFSVALLQDTCCYAYAEKVYTKILEPDFAYINFSLGIGSALFIGGELLGGASGSHSQFGHFSLDPNGKLCSCGNRGCLETLLTENMLKERVEALGISPALHQLSRITYADLGKAAVYGDTIAQQVIRSMAREFTIALADLVCVVRPTLVVLGGHCKDLGTLFLNEIKQNLKSIGFRRMIDTMDLRYTELDRDAYLNGAMKYFFDIHYVFTEDMTGDFFIG